MRKINIWIATLTLGSCLYLTGCYNDPLDPTQIGRFEPTPTVNVILDTLGVADEPSPTYEGAEEPRPEDLIATETDYVFGPGDQVRISIFELYQEGIAYINDYVVTETGRLSIPDVGMVRAEGLTEAELEREIASILSPNIIKDPSITVTLISSQQQIFSIFGQGVAQSSRFAIPRNTTFRLSDAIAVAGGTGDFNVSYIYVSRDVPADQMKSDNLKDTGVQLQEIQLRKDSEQEMLEMITPSSHRKSCGLLITSAEMATRQELEALAAPEGVDPLTEELFEEPAQADDLLVQPQGQTKIDWVFEDGQWKPIQVDSSETKTRQQQVLQTEHYAANRTDIPSDFGLDDVGTTEMVTRVIQIPRDRLEAGDPRYDIIIRPGDRITVPRDVVGEFWVTGNVNAPNAYSITGRPITLKQAIATAGGLNAIAWPKKVEVVRRIGKNKSGLMQEEIVMVDLQKIAKGIQPDFFIKPYDYINVGTHGTSRWRQSLRNAFRPVYGFGFTYDRNFFESDFGDNPITNPF